MFRTFIKELEYINTGLKEFISQILAPLLTFVIPYIFTSLITILLLTPFGVFKPFSFIFGIYIWLFISFLRWVGKSKAEQQKSKQSWD